MHCSFKEFSLSTLFVLVLKKRVVTIYYNNVLNSWLKITVLLIMRAQAWYLRTAMINQVFILIMINQVNQFSDDECWVAYNCMNRQHKHTVIAQLCNNCIWISINAFTSLKLSQFLSTHDQQQRSQQWNPKINTTDNTNPNIDRTALSVTQSQNNHCIVG